MLLPPLTCCVLVHKHFETQNLLILYNLANWLQLSMHFAFVAIDKIDFGHLSAFSVKLFSFRKRTIFYMEKCMLIHVHVYPSLIN